MPYSSGENRGRNADSRSYDRRADHHSLSRSSSPSHTSGYRHQDRSYIKSERTSVKKSISPRPHRSSEKQRRSSRRLSSPSDESSMHPRESSPISRPSRDYRKHDRSIDSHKSDLRHDRSRRRHRDRDNTRSRSPQRLKDQHSHVRESRHGLDVNRTNGDETDSSKVAAAGPEKEGPNFARTGKLAAETNTVQGTKIVLKYHEPPEARLPPASSDWRMYEFKGQDTVSTTELSKRSCWLIGREQAVVDFFIAHPSCSAQHAVLQFRHVEKRNEYGDRIGRVRLYVIDLDSSNGTKLNGERIEDRRFIEVKNTDVLRFGDSTREYVILLA